MITRVCVPRSQRREGSRPTADRIADPAARLARPGRDLDASLARPAGTLSVDDIALSGLLDRLAVTPLADGLVTGAAVYRSRSMTPPWSSRSASPLSGQLILSAVLGSATSSRPLQEALGRSEDGRISVEDTELSAEEYARYQADVAEESRPPFQAPDGLAAAVAAARAAGLLAPVTRGDEPVLHFVRRWTARALAALRPGATRHAHQQAAAFWRWRVATLPQNREDAIDQLGVLVRNVSPGPNARDRVGQTGKSPMTSS